MHSPSSLRRSPRALGSLFTASLIAVAAAAHAATPVSSVSMGLPTVLSGATLVSHVSSSTVLSMEMSLTPTNRAALTAYARSVSNPLSPNFHRFLSPVQVGAQFGASAATVNATVAYLKANGMTVNMVADNHMAILFSGKVSSVESAFSTKINNYKVASRKSPGPLTFFSNATVPKAPSTFASQVVTIQGLSNANQPIRKTSQLRPIDARNVYNATPLYGSTTTDGHKGEGINIGISNFDGYRLSNAAVYANAFNLPLPGGTGTNITKVIVGGVDGETQSPQGEGDLDFQMVLAIAPKANIYIYDGIGGGLIATLAKEAQDNIVDIVTESYGFLAGDDFYSAAHDQHLAMTAQGITYMGASGDSGTADLINDPYPDFDPDVLEVGGSDVTLSSAGDRGSELGWVGSGSGWYQGTIDFNVLPPYQVGYGVPTGNNHRLIPDIALHATAWYFSYNSTIQGVGGTSAATPSFAGQLGLILQTLAESGSADLASNGRPRLGRIQDFLYALNADSVSSAFFDITQMDGSGNAGTLPDGTLSVAKPGWDFVTGLGAPNDNELYNAFLGGTNIATIDDSANSANVYAISTPSLTLGTAVQGDVTALDATDATTYSVQTVTQPGVGQVAAATFGMTLNGDATKRLSLSLTAAINTPSLTVSYIYLLNSTTNAYDLVSTVIGTGSMTTAKVNLTNATDLAKYASTGTMTALIRATKPARLGAAPFRMDIDQLTATERISSN